jgi:predicted Zn-dependent protease
MLTKEEMAQGRTLAEAQGMTAELGREMARLASEEMREGRLDLARQLLETLAATNPRDAIPWALLAQVERRQGRTWPAYLYAEAAAHLAPKDLQVRLVRAEVLLTVPEQGGVARTELSELSRAEGRVGERARQLLKALGS